MYGKEEKKTITEEKQKRKRILIIVLTIGVLLFAALLVRSIVLGGNGNKLQKQLDLGTKYLDDMDYEQALVAFEATLDIDPMNVDAYLGIVEVYIRTNEFEKALEVAKEGYETTGYERLKEKMDMIESGNIFAANGWVMRSSCYDNDGNLLYYHQYTYNQKGQKASVARYDANGIETQYLELDYDGEDRPITSYINSMDDGRLFKVVFEYSNNGYRETEYSSIDGDVCGYFEAETDADGKVLKNSFYDKNGNLQNSSECKYDEHGNEIRVNSYDAEGNMESYYIYTYDEEDKLLQIQLYTPDEEMYEYIEPIYDEGGNCIGYRNCDGDGKLYTETINQ